jgi:CubicO group peptidase (beta-lactamase class C family)
MIRERNLYWRFAAGSIFCLSLIQLIGCNKSPTEPSGEPIDLSGALQTASPVSQGIDAFQLATAYKQAQQTIGLRSLLVARNGKLVAEEYYNNYDRTQLNHVRSVTKSVISALIGIALDKGLIKSVDQTLADYPISSSLDQQKRQISIRHLLTMTSGLQWNEISGPDYSNWISSGDQIEYVLQKPLVATPGQQFTYNSGAVHLLSVLLTKATGMNTLAFADEHLFDPLGITEKRWEQVSGGYYNGGAGLELHARDMVKLGLLFLQNGFSGKQPVVPAGWVAQSTQAQQRLGFVYSAMNNVNYGYLWWLDSGQSRPAFLAWGYGGQFIYCVPALNLVIVTTSQWQLSAADADQQEIANLNLIINYVVKAVKS